VANMLSLTWRGSMPRWAVQVLGGTVILGLIGVWLASSLWLFMSKGMALLTMRVRLPIAKGEVPCSI
jgi:hypothetical protein